MEISVDDINNDWTKDLVGVYCVQVCVPHAPLGTHTCTVPLFAIRAYELYCVDLASIFQEFEVSQILEIGLTNFLKIYDENKDKMLWFINNMYINLIMIYMEFKEKW